MQKSLFFVCVFVFFLVGERIVISTYSCTEETSLCCDEKSCEEESGVKNFVNQIDVALENNLVSNITTIRECPYYRIGDWTPVEVYILEVNKNNPYPPTPTYHQSDKCQTGVQTGGGNTYVQSVSVAQVQNEDQLYKLLRRLLQDFNSDEILHDLIIGSVTRIQR